MVNKEEIMKMLSTVNDPEVHQDIVSLKMVKDVIIEKNDVKILIALTVKGCPLADTIRSDIVNAVSKLKEVENIDVQMTTMSQQELNEFRGVIQSKMGQNKISKDYEVASINKLKRASIQNVIAVISGKGGVGKSFITSIIASELRRSGFEVGILDADVTGPSIAKLFGLSSRPSLQEGGIVPAVTETGIKVMSVNLLLDDPEKPTIWRGPIINNLIRQLFMDVNWGELHYLIVDLPPGTSDAPLTVFQSLPLSGVVTVTTPQDLARLIVTKSANMAKMLKVPLIGLVENMSYFECGHCNKKTSLLGPSHGKESAEYLETELLGKVAVDPKISILSDNGQIEKYESVELKKIVERIRIIVSDMSETEVNIPIAWKAESSDKKESSNKKFELKPI